MEHHLCSASHNHCRRAFVLKMDVCGYFMGIDRNILLRIVRESPATMSLHHTHRRMRRIVHRLHILETELQVHTPQHTASVLNSYLGVLCHYHTWKLRNSFFTDAEWSHAGLFSMSLSRFASYNRWWENPLYGVRLLK